MFLAWWGHLNAEFQVTKGIRKPYFRTVIRTAGEGVPVETYMV